MALTTTENLISNMSYTEKDFQAIYPALLDLIKKETAKWDPSSSNESDPGVLLLKLNAIIADKCNYNIDKNVLECFPASVTQNRNARQLFEQLGYYMHWYKAATTVVTLKYIGDTPTDDDGQAVVLAYSIPKFTTICNDDSDLVYTLIDSKTVKTNGAAVSFKALQGVAVDYDINGETLITTANLDSNNRLYFNETNIAENGIFITNAGDNNYSSWIKKDNLLIEEMASDAFNYKFGVSQDLSTCYLEFPENAEEIFQEGIKITYIKTNGADGNIASGGLTNFYNGLSVTDPQDETKTVTLTTDTIKIANYVVGAGGSNAETINEAYLGYKKIVGTFDTLITLRDYANAIKQSDYVSNGIICDRTNDVQSSYQIMSKTGSLNQLLNEVEINTNYDIKGFYDEEDTKMFYEVDDDGEVLYDSPYEADDTKNYYDVIKRKSYRVLFNNGQASYHEADKVDKPAMDAFDLKMYILSSTSGLYENATNYKTSFTLNTDATIQAIVESEIDDYKCVQHNFADVDVDKICFIKNKYPLDCKIIPQYSLTEAQKKEVTTAIQKALYSNLNSEKVDFGTELTYEEIYNIILEADSRIKAVSLAPLSYKTYAVYEKKISDTEAELTEVDITDYIYYTDAAGLKHIDYTQVGNLFRNEIYAKSVLAGRTQFFVQDTKFNYGINQKYQLLKDNIGRIDTNLELTFDSTNDNTHILNENEVVELFAPNLIEHESFSSNAKIEYYIPSGSIPAAGYYTLRGGEFAIFYYTQDDTDGYAYKVYGEGATLHPSFNMNTSVAQVTDLVGNELTQTSKLVTVTVNNQSYLYNSGNTLSENVSASLNTLVKNMTGANNLLSGSKEVDIVIQNSITIKAGEQLCYWILNEQTNSKYVLFDDEIGNERILGENEVFIYMDANSSETVVCGSGTFINREQGTEGETISCSAAVSYEEFIKTSGAADLISQYAVTMPRDISVSEMQYKSFAEGMYVKITPGDNKYLAVDDYTNVTGTLLEHCITTNLTEGKEHKLVSGEYIAFYTPVYQTDRSLDYYKFDIYGEGAVIIPSYALATQKSSASELVGKDLANDTICQEREIWEHQETEAFHFGTGSTADFSGLTDAITNSLTASANNIPDGECLNGKAIRIIPGGITLTSDTKNPTSLSNYEVKYRTSINDAWETVPSVILGDSSLSWTARALLRLDVSKTSPQKLLENQTVIFYTYDADENHIYVDDDHDEFIAAGHTEAEWDEVKPISVEPGVEPFTSIPTYLLTSETISSIGPHISTLTKDVDDNWETTSIYAYIYGDYDDGVKYKDDGTTEIKFDEGETEQEQTLTFRLPSGNYIVPVVTTFPDDTLTSAEIYFKATTGDFEPLLFMNETAEYYNTSTTYEPGDYVLYKISTYEVNKYECLKECTGILPTSTVEWRNLGRVNNIVSNGNYYLDLKNLSDGGSTEAFVTLKVIVRYKPGEEGTVTTLYLYPIFKYSNGTVDKDENVNKELFVTLYELIKKLDYHNRFDYTYVVDEDEEVEDPLESTAYLDTNHVYNKYTICQMETAKDKFSIQITNVIKGS